MKKYTGFLSALLMLQTSVAFADTVNGSASASVMENLIISNQQPLNFGFITPTSTAGTVTITTDNNRIATGGAQVSNSFSRATFHISGAPGSTYSIVTPSSQTFTSSDAALHPGLVSTLTVDNFITFSVGSGSQSVFGKLNSSGQDDVYLGGLLTVPANAAPGVYSGLVPITVSY